MKKFKALYGKHYEVLAIQETDDSIPEGENIYYDLAKDMRIPDFILIRADDATVARQQAEEFIARWRARLGD